MNDHDRQAMARFCEQEHGRLVSILTLHLGDRLVAEELANEALITMCERWSTFDQLRNPQAYVTRVALNKANSWIRRRMAERRANARHGAGATTSHTDPDSADVMAIREAVLKLPRRQREALVLRYWADMTPPQAAEVMGVADGTVRALTHQAVAALRTTFTFDLAEETADVR